MHLLPPLLTGARLGASQAFFSSRSEGKDGEIFRRDRRGRLEDRPDHQRVPLRVRPDGRAGLGARLFARALVCAWCGRDVCCGCAFCALGAGSSHAVRFVVGLRQCCMHQMCPERMFCRWSPRVSGRVERRAQFTMITTFLDGVTCTVTLKPYVLILYLPSPARYERRIGRGGANGRVLTGDG